MITLARFIMAGPSQAALVVAVTAILAVIMPPMAWLSGAGVALTVLHLGPRRGIQLIGFSGLAVMVLGWIAIGTPMLAFGMILLLWMPVWLAAVVLYRSVSMALALQLISAMALLFVLILHWAYPDLQLVLRQEFTDIIQSAIDQQPTAEAKQALVTALDSVLPLLPGLLAMGMMMGAVLSLLLGRWWQAALYNPGGYAEEFNELRLGKVPAIASGLLLAAALLTSNILVVMLMLVVLLLYVIQGLAMIHGVLALKQINKVWLVGLYFSIFIMPQLVVLPVAVVGLTDAWIDYRRRVNPAN
jgi:Predicted membrane protein (DUF2232)